MTGPAPDAPPLVRISGLTKVFGAVTALDDVTFDIVPGERLGLVGPDGAGKSTLLSLLAGLGSADAGTMHRAPDVAARTAFMPQSAGLYDDLPVADNLHLFARLRGGADAAAMTRVAEAAGLAPFMDRPAGKLSGGMRQKLGLAATLVTRPLLALLDEPSVGVDPVSRAELWALAQRLAADGSALVWATSNLEEAQACDRVILMNGGRILFAGPPAAISDTLAGRVWRLGLGGIRARRVLAAALAHDDVLDATIQGASVRLLLREGAPPPDQGALAQLTPQPLALAPPRLEDGFIDRLGGARLPPSPLTTAYRTIAPGRGDAGAGDVAMIEARGLVRRFGDFTAVNGVDIRVLQGEIFGLLGPNGAGKTTSFRMLCGLLPPTSGSARVAGCDIVRQRTDAHQQLGYMAQKFSLYATLTVRQNLAFFAGAYGLGGAAARRAVDDALTLLDLADHANAEAGALTPGLRQRLALACAIMHQPPILFLDEPTSGVDPLTRRVFWSHINAMAERGVTIFITTHFMDEAEYCDRIALIHQGRVVAADTPDGLKAATGGAASLEAAFFKLLATDPDNLGTVPKLPKLGTVPNFDGAAA